MDLSDWREAVSEMNVQFDELDYSRDEIYGWMAEKIKDIFFKHINYTPSIHFTSDGRLVEVKFTEDTISNKVFSPEIFNEIGMKFSIRYEFDDNADYCLYLRFYPFEEV